MQGTIKLLTASTIVLLVLICLTGISTAQNKEYENNAGHGIPENQISGIMIYLDPPDARIFINGEEIKTSGAIELDPGSYELELACDGYHTQKKTILLKSGQITGLRISLDKVLDRPFYKYGSLLGVSASYNGGYELPAPSLAANKENMGYGLFGGMFINFPLTKSYFLRTEISYLRWEFDYGNKRETYKEWDAFLDSLVIVAAWYHVDLDYINFSFLFTQANLGSKGYIHFSLGPSVSILSKKRITIEPGDFTGEIEQLVTKKAYFGFNIGSSVGKRVFFDARLHLGFSNMRDYNYGKPFHLRFAAGYRL